MLDVLRETVTRREAPQPVAAGAQRT
jgi:hypothetical protein